MGTFNLTITYQDADQSEIVATLQAYYGIPGATAGQIRTAMQNEVSQNIKQIIRSKRAQNAAAAIADPVIT